MSVLDAVRKLGEAIQQDERFIRYAKAKLENDNNEELQNAIGDFNIVRMDIDREMSSENQNDEKVKELNEKLRKLYMEIMSSPAMAEYNAAKAELDTMLNDINNVIAQCVDGADPATCEPETSACTGSCSTCGGCH